MNDSISLGSGGNNFTISASDILAVPSTASDFIASLASKEEKVKLDNLKKCDHNIHTLKNDITFYPITMIFFSLNDGINGWFFIASWLVQ